MLTVHKFTKVQGGGHSSKIYKKAVALCAAVALSAGAMADPVVIAPGNGVSTNALTLYTGDTVLSVNPGASGGGIVTLNKGNSHTGGTSLGCGTLVVTDVGGGGRSPVGTGVFSPGAGTLRYAGPAGATLGANVAPSFESGSTAACVFDVQNDLTYAGVWNQSYGGFIKTGPGTLSIAGNANATNWFGAADLLGVTDVFTDALLKKKIVFNANGDAPTEGFGPFSVVEGTFRINGGVNVFGSVSNAPSSQVGAWTTDEGMEKSAVLEIAGGTNTFVGYLVVGKQNGGATTGGAGVQTGVRVTGGSTTVKGRLVFGWNGDTTAFPKLDSRPFYEQTGGTVKLNDNLQLGYSNTKGVQASITMTGGTLDLNGKNLVSGYGATYTTNTIDVSGTAYLVGAANFYTYSGTANRMDINVHDGGTIGFTTTLYNNGTTPKTNLRVDGGVLRNDKSGSKATTLFTWIGNSDTTKQLTSFTIGPKGATFRAKNGNSSGVAQVYSPMTAEPAGEGETAAGVTIDSGRFAYYVAMDYEGPTIIKNGGVLYISMNGSLPEASAVTVEGGGTLRLLATSKTIPTLTLAEDAILAFGTPTDGPTSPTLTVSDTIVLPSRAKIELYSGNTPTGTAKSDDGTYNVLKVPVSYADALRAVKWTCSSITNRKTPTFDVTTDDEYATLSMTISDDTADGVYPAGTITSTSGSLSVSSDFDIYGTLEVGGNVTGSATGGSITVRNGGVLDVPNGEIKTSDSQFFDLYLEDGGSIFVKNIQATSTTWDSNTRECFHFNGGTIYPLYGATASGSSYWQMILNYQYATLGEHGLTIDMSRWARPDYISDTAWVRISVQGRINHDPDCAGSDGGIVVQGSSDERLQIYFGGRMNPSTFNGDILVKDGCIASSVSYALLDKTLVMEPGTRLRPFFGDTPIPVQVGSLTLGAANATKPVALDTSNRANPGCYVVSNVVSVLSSVELGTCQNWDSDIGISAGTFTTLVYKATCSVDPTLFRLSDEATAAGYTLSAEEVTIDDGDYEGWKALVCKVSSSGVSANNLVVTGSASGPSPVTVSEDAAYDSIVLGGTWGGVEDPCTDTSLTISGDVTASTALYLGYNPRPGVDQYHPHQGFLTIESGASLSVPVVYSCYRTTPIDNQQNPRYGCEVTVDGGQLNVSGDVRFGQQVSKSGDKLYSQLTVNNGGRVTVGGTFYLYYYLNTANTGIPGCIVLNDGEVDVKGPVDLSRNSKVNTKTGGVHYDSILYHFGLYLNGGVLKADTIKMTDSASIPKVYFNGTTFMPYGKTESNRTMQNLNKVYVSTNGAIISTANMPAGETYTIAQPLLTDPALNGVADGGFTKKGAGTLALTGANTFTGPVRIEDGTLVAGSAGAISDVVELSDTAVLDLNNNNVTLRSITACGIVANGGITVTNTLYVSEDSYMSVEGDFTLGNHAKVDFGVSPGEKLSKVWRPVVAAGGNVSVPSRLKAVNGGERVTYCNTFPVDGVVYMRASSSMLVIIIR